MAPPIDRATWQVAAFVRKVCRPAPPANCCGLPAWLIELPAAEGSFGASISAIKTQQIQLFTRQA